MDEIKVLMPNATAEEIYRQVTFFDTVQVAKDGQLTQRSGVEWAPIESAGPLRAPLATVDQRRVTPRVQAFVDGADAHPLQELEVEVALDRHQWDDTQSVPYQQALAMIRGTAKTTCDLDRVRRDTVARRRALADKAMAPVIEAIERLGARVIATSNVSGAIHVSANPQALAGIIKLPAVQVVTHRADSTTDAGISMTVTGPLLDGEESHDLLQTRPYHDDGFEGRPKEYIAVFEGGASEVYSEHVSFYSGPSILPSSVRRVTACDRASVCDLSNLPCMSQSNPVGNPHATSATSVIASDLTRGQDLLLATTTGELQRTGIAPRSKVFTMSDVGTAERAAALAIVSCNGTKIISKSASSKGIDPLCNGDTSLDRDYNAMYEEGVATFQSNGNQGNGVCGDCNMATPGNAIGVFASSAYEVNALGDEVLFFKNSRGGTQFEGNGRTITGLLTPSKRTLLAEADSTMAPTYTTGGFCCSSGSTPHLSGAAALFRDFYLATYSTLIDEPGILYTNLLLMGDRYHEDGGYLAEGFDGLTGAGKLRLRRFDQPGLDAPATWKTGSRCIQHGATTTIDIGTLDADVDYVKAVIWWYDAQHDAGNPHDKIDLELQQQIGSLPFYVTYWSSRTDDNRQRIYATNAGGVGVGGQTLRLRIKGRWIQGETDGCGTDANRVFFAVIAEENDRDDDVDLTTYVRPESTETPSSATCDTSYVDVDLTLSGSISSGAKLVADCGQTDQRAEVSGVGNSTTITCYPGDTLELDCTKSGTSNNTIEEIYEVNPGTQFKDCNSNQSSCSTDFNVTGSGMEVVCKFDNP